MDKYLNYWGLVFVVIIMVCSLCACENRTAGTMTNTDSSIGQVSMSENVGGQLEEGESSKEQPEEQPELKEETEPKEQSTDDTGSDTVNFENKDNWPDVVELVNLRGDETTAYLLADGRYMDRTNAVYIYDGKETWIDESGVEWSEAVK